jgi:4-hydroxybenzoate polyprenyltransferase/phosphoserine phosphatase
MSIPATQPAASTDIACPLCVDLDGTLISSDLLWESAILLFRQHPLTALSLPLWLLKGKAHLKEQLAQRVTPNAALLPYREQVLDFIKSQKATGRRIVLATASNVRPAQAVADHLGLFDEILASDETRNLAGHGKLAAIQQRFQTTGFEYIGDSPKDLPIWHASRAAYLVCPTPRLRTAASQGQCKSIRVLSEPTLLRTGILRSLRPTQWVKNILVFLPLILAHKISDHQKLRDVCLAFTAFCLCASAIYIFNDLLDLESDRAHPRKRLRPFASGALSIPIGLALIAILLPLSFLAAATVSHAFLGLLLLYLIFTSAYSTYVKGRLLLDVMLLSYLYTHRILSGAIAAQVEITPWLLAFSLFFFLSLAFAKRYSELTLLQLSNRKQATGRSYSTDDLDVILSVGPACGYMSVLVFCLYINSPIAEHLYKRPMFLWIIAPLLLYWITRIWFFAKRQVLVDDPILFAIQDRVSWIAGALATALVIAATL